MAVGGRVSETNTVTENVSSPQTYRRFHCKQLVLYGTECATKEVWMVCTQVHSL